LISRKAEFRSNNTEGIGGLQDFKSIPQSKKAHLPITSTLPGTVIDFSLPLAKQ
jgi:hypothetical protein